MKVAQSCLTLCNPHGRQPARLLCPWDCPGKSTGVGCHCLLPQYRRHQFNSWVRKICWRRDRLPTPIFLGFPCGLAGKESSCKTGDPSLIPGSGISPGEEIGYPLQYSWASLVAQLVKNPPAMQETPVRFLGWEDLLEKG